MEVAMNWKAYNSLAWTTHILASPNEYESEVMVFIDAIKKYAVFTPMTMLHLGCGAGGHDFHFKRYFRVTGIDISEGMLEIAKHLNPEAHYIRGDMRSIDLDQKFDVVIIPESIMYMTSLCDLKMAIKTAVNHLQPKGILLLVTHTKEEYRDNNFAYTGTSGDIHITLFENNHLIDENLYEATLIYLIRMGSKIKIESEVHVIGVFSHQIWADLFMQFGLTVNEIRLDHQYDQFLLEDSEYKLTTFIGVKPDG
jgi:SAM-dependent methyltransferase